MLYLVRTLSLLLALLIGGYAGFVQGSAAGCITCKVEYRQNTGGYTVLVQQSFYVWNTSEADKFCKKTMCPDNFESIGWGHGGNANDSYNKDFWVCTPFNPVVDDNCPKKRAICQFALYEDQVCKVN